MLLSPLYTDTLNISAASVKILYTQLHSTNNVHSYIYEHSGYLPFTDNTPEVLSMPIILVASQVYVPTSDDSAFIIFRVLSIMDSFRYVDELIYLELSEKFTITPLRYHLIYGTGTPMARHTNCILFVSFSSKSVNGRIISGATERKVHL